MDVKENTPLAALEDGWLSAIVSYVAFTMRRFYNDGMLQSVGALTYSTLLALVPLLVIAFAIFSAFPAFEAAQERLQAIVFDSIVPETSEDVRVYLNQFTSNAEELTAVGVIALVLSAILLLFTIEATLNRVWHVKRERPLLTRLLVFWAVLTLGPLLLAASFIVSSDFLILFYDWTNESTVTMAIPNWLRITFAVVIQATVFTAIFRLVPASPVLLLDAAIGGMIGGVGFELLKWGFAASIASSSTYSTIYGAVSSAPIFLIWTYASWTVVIIGAVFAASLPDWRSDRQIAKVEHFGPNQILVAAVSVLDLLAHQTRQAGHAIDPQRFAEVAPLNVRDMLITKLISKGYLVETGNNALVLSRDLERTTLADLVDDLGLALGTSTDVSTVYTELDMVLSRLGDAEKDILDCPIACFVQKSAECDRSDAPNGN